jgi:hypothetical protein
MANPHYSLNLLVQVLKGTKKWKRPQLQRMKRPQLQRMKCFFFKSQFILQSVVIHLAECYDEEVLQ